MPYPDRRRGGAGFPLGPTQNVFDSGAGDQAAAELLRDNYATANPSWLAAYDDSDIHIELRYVDGGDAVAIKQNRIGGAWVTQQSTFGVRGLPGSGTDFSNIPDYNLPLIGPGPDKIPQPSGIVRTENGTGAYEFQETAAFPQESIQIGFSGILSALGAVPLFRSFVTGRRGTFPFTYYDPAAGTNRTVEIVAAGTQNVPIQTDTGTELTSGGTIQFATTAAEVIHKINLTPKTGSEPTDLRMRFTVQGQSEPFYYWPSKTQWDNNGGGSVPANGELDIVNAPMFLLGILDPQDPITISVEYAFANGVLLGSPTTPAISVDRNVVDLEQLARLGDVTNLGLPNLTNDDGRKILEAKPDGTGYFLTDPPMQFRGAWDNTSAYARHDVVTDDGKVWIVDVASNTTGYTDFKPSENTDVWTCISEDADAFNSASRDRGYITLSRDNGEDVSLSVSDFDRVYRNLGQGAGSGNSISINLIESAWVDCHPDCSEISRIYLPSNGNLDSDESFVIDFTRVTSDKTFDIEIPNTVFRDGATSTTIKAGHMLKGWAHIDDSGQPQGPTNPVRVYFAQLAADGDMGPVFHPEFENTIIVSNNGDDTLDGKTLPRAVETISRARALQSGETGYKQTLCLDASAFTESGTIILETGEDLNIPFAEYTGDISGPVSGHCNVEIYKHFGLLGVGTKDHFYIREQSGNITIQGVSHDNTKLVIDDLQSGAITFDSAATGILYLEINNVYSGFAPPTIPSGLSVIGRIGDQYLMGSTDSAPQPAQTNTVYLNPTEGFTGSQTDGNNRTFPFSLIGDALTEASTKPGGDHKQIVVDEEVTLGDINNNATGGSNVPNIALIAKASTVNSFSSIGHAFRLEARRIDLLSGDSCVISHNDDIEVDVVTGTNGQNITFDTVTIGHARFKAKSIGPDTAIDFSNMAAMASGSALRIEIDRYEGSIGTALNTIPDDAIYMYGWIGDVEIQSSSNGKVWSRTIDSDGSIVTTGYNTP